MTSLILQVFQNLEKQIQESEYNRYIKKLKFNRKSSSDDFLVFNVDNELISKFIQTKYAATLAKLYEELSQIKAKIHITSKQHKEKAEEKLESKIQAMTLNSDYVFENFIVGPSNLFAATCSKFVAQNPGVDFNPLFIYGPSGLGKTHLLQSIGNFCLKNKKAVLCITSEQFISDFTQSIKSNEKQEFMKKYRDCDILLIDDIQFLKNAERTQEEFFHIFNALKQNNRQIVLTSDLAPKKLLGFEERLQSRFESGVIADITIPELETKIKIIENKCLLNNFPLEQNIIEYLAINLGNSIREIESSINKLRAFSNLLKKDIDLKFARSVIENQISEHVDSVTIEEIINKVALQFNVLAKDINSKSRKSVLVKARSVAIYLIKELTSIPMPQIAKFFAMKDHSAISKSIQRVYQMMEEDHDFQVSIEELKNKIVIS